MAGIKHVNRGPVDPTRQITPRNHTGRLMRMIRTKRPTSCTWVTPRDVERGGRGDVGGGGVREEG